ncbi:MAG: hypothetical protein ACRDYB_14410 [Acidimicrobiales bacterium]
MDDPVRTEQVGSRTLAAITATTDRASLTSTIFQLLDKVWPVLRGQDVRTDHNIVTYRPTDDGTLQIEAGVEVIGDFHEDGPTSATTAISAPPTPRSMNGGGPTDGHRLVSAGRSTGTLTTTPPSSAPTSMSS